MEQYLQELFESLKDPRLLLLGIPAQMMFFSRFLVQWVVSEKKGKSVVPFAFWVLSILGSAGLLIYGILKAEWVLIMGHALNSIIYTRNIMLISREKKALAEKLANAQS